MGFTSAFKGLIAASGWLIHLNYIKKSVKAVANQSMGKGGENVLVYRNKSD